MKQFADLAKARAATVPEYFGHLLQTAADAGVPALATVGEETLAKFAADASSDHGRAKARAKTTVKVFSVSESVPATIRKDYPRLVQLAAFEVLAEALERAEKAATAAFNSEPAE